MKTQKRFTPGYWSCQILGWGLIGPMSMLYSASFDGQTETSTHAEHIRLAVWMLAGFFSTHFMRTVIKKWRLLDLHPRNQTIWILSLTLVFALFTSVVTSVIILSMLTLHTVVVSDAEIRTLAIRTLLGSLVILLVWNSIYFLLHYVVKYRRQERQALHMAAAMKDVELMRIKASMNPHFVFNALNSIRALVGEDPSLARAAVTSLGNILRSSINMEKRDTLLLRDELAIVNDYLSLQKIRFEERLALEFDIEAAALDCHIPSLMLQTLVENAVKHGYSARDPRMIIRIRARRNHDLLEIIVQNSGVLGASVGITGFGLKSTRDRLTLLYGKEASLDIRQSTEDIVEARVVMPGRAATEHIHHLRWDFGLNGT